MVSPLQPMEDRRAEGESSSAAATVAESTVAGATGA
jgi:hypothetical protein